MSRTDGVKVGGQGWGAGVAKGSLGQDSFTERWRLRPWVTQPRKGSEKNRRKEGPCTRPATGMSEDPYLAFLCAPLLAALLVSPFPRDTPSG